VQNGRAAIFGQSAFQRDLVADITLDHNQGFATDHLNPVQRGGIAVAKIIKNDDLLASV